MPTDDNEQIQSSSHNDGQGQSQQAKESTPDSSPGETTESSQTSSESAPKSPAEHRREVLARLRGEAPSEPETTDDDSDDVEEAGAEDAVEVEVEDVDSAPEEEPADDDRGQPISGAGVVQKVVGDPSQAVRAVVSYLKTADSTLMAHTIVGVTQGVNPGWTLGERWDSAQDAWAEIRPYVFKGERLWPHHEVLIDRKVIAADAPIMAIVVVRSATMRWVGDRLETLAARP